MLACLVWFPACGWLIHFSQRDNWFVWKGKFYKTYNFFTSFTDLWVVEFISYTLFLEYMFSVGEIQLSNLNVTDLVLKLVDEFDRWFSILKLVTSGLGYF